MATSRRPLRADARRNYDAIVDAAVAEVDRKGVAASLEEIARSAGVGSATLHRHFPSRRILLQAVFKDRVAALCTRADALAATTDADTALRTWLTELAVYSAATRGLADTLDLPPEPDADARQCEIMLSQAADKLRDAAVAVGTVSREVAAQDLLALVNAISLSSRNHPDPRPYAQRLLEVALNGVSRGRDASTIADR